MNRQYNEELHESNIPTESKKFFCDEYNANFFKSEEGYKAIKFGREGCFLFKQDGDQGNHVYKFIHKDF